jgi:hypothetical protein
MQIAELTKDKPERILIQVQNDSANALVVGEPVAFAMDGTDDGLDIHQLSDSTAAKSLFFAGVCTEAIAAGARGKIQAYGVVTKIKFVMGTRAASTDPYASSPAIVLGDVMLPNTVANAFSRQAAGLASAYMPVCVAIGTTGASASSASTTADSSTARTGTIKAFVRAM